jgi:hypothetical protein
MRRTEPMTISDLTKRICPSPIAWLDMVRPCKEPKFAPLSFSLLSSYRIYSRCVLYGRSSVRRYFARSSCPALSSVVDMMLNCL